MQYPPFLQILLNDYVNSSRGSRNVFNECSKVLKESFLRELFTDIGYLSMLSTNIVTYDDNIRSQQISEKLQNIQYNVSLAKDYYAPTDLYEYLVSEIIVIAKTLLYNKSLSVADTVELINIISTAGLTDSYKDLLKETLQTVFTSSNFKSISSDSWSHIFKFISNSFPEEQQRKILSDLAHKIVTNEIKEDFERKCEGFERKCEAFEYQYYKVYEYFICSLRLTGISKVKFTESLEDLTCFDDVELTAVPEEDIYL
ncbi:hypothetical protein Trichorick_01363 [Candidatus Trichorickettsia mobilis]|uniref:Uncharacterized protein n=1 Tax=Candidatus Trichorickettsia mobilis TaxID=1346319 RepID=A0ABZ0UW79_9RICK|nr:hypothetical protein [Candidatus Trichorickettsia mobilis]WPY01450.1 hypothetical protein Trichorick_01363 [Candidatus Trichorickettsia mobilis]